jgi:hypothetical protein
VYVSPALGGWTFGLQRAADGSTRVWFFRRLSFGTGRARLASRSSAIWRFR